VAIIGAGGSNTRSEHVLGVREEGAAKAEAGIRRIDKATDELAKTVARYAATYFGARGMYSALTSVVRLYSEQEAAEKKLAAVAGIHTEALIKQAAAFQQVTRYGDEQIIDAQRLLITYGIKTPQALERATQAAMDLAATYGWDLSQAVRNVGKTMGGFAGELGEVVPELRALTAEQLKNGEGVALLARKYAGASAADVNTLSGSMSQAANAAGDLGEQIGATLATPLSKMSGLLTEIIPKLTQLFSIANQASLSDITMGLLLYDKDAIKRISGPTLKAFYDKVIQDFIDKRRKQPEPALGGYARRGGPDIGAAFASRFGRDLRRMGARAEPPPLSGGRGPRRRASGGRGRTAGRSPAHGRHAGRDRGQHPAGGAGLGRGRRVRVPGLLRLPREPRQQDGRQDRQGDAVP